MFSLSRIRYRSLVIGVCMVAYGVAGQAWLVLIGGVTLFGWGVVRSISRVRDADSPTGRRFGAES